MFSMARISPFAIRSLLHKAAQKHCRKKAVQALLALSLEQRCAGEPFVSPEIATILSFWLWSAKMRASQQACAMCHRSSSGSLTRFRSSWAGDSSALRPRALPRAVACLSSPRAPASFRTRVQLSRSGSAWARTLLEQTGRRRYRRIRPHHGSSTLMEMLPARRQHDPMRSILVLFVGCRHSQAKQVLSAEWPYRLTLQQLCPATSGSSHGFNALAHLYRRTIHRRSSDGQSFTPGLDCMVDSCVRTR